MGKARLVAAISLLLLIGVLVPLGNAPTVAAADATVNAVGLVNPITGQWYLRAPGTGAVTEFYFGNPGDIPFMGDWDCDGEATPGLFRVSDAYAYLRNSNSQGNADIRFYFGNPSDLPLAGDFNGDGCDTLSLYRPSQQRFYIMNKLGENEGGLGEADYSFQFGNPGDKPVVGDWDGDGIDEIGLHRESTGYFYYRSTLDTGVANGEFFFGNPDDRFVAGDWGIVDGVETPAVFRPSSQMFYFRHTNTGGPADSEFGWGESGWLPVSYSAGPQVSVTVEPASLLLDGPGATDSLSAEVRDDAGPVSADVFWTSDDPAVARVSAGGTVTAVAMGQASITASSLGTRSDPVYVFVADLADDAVQVDDDEIVAEPRMVSSPTPDIIGTLYEVTVDRSSAPQVGEIFVGSRESGVAGRVTAVAFSGNFAIVEFEAVPLTDVFDSIEVEVSEPLLGLTGRSLPVYCNAEGHAGIGGLHTLGARLENNLSLSHGAGLEVKTKWKVIPTGVRAHAHAVVEGGLNLIFEGSLSLEPSASGAAECFVTFGRPYFPIWGPFGAVVDLGAGVSLTGQANSDPLTLDASILVPVTTKIGFEWENSDLDTYEHIAVGSPQVNFDIGTPSGWSLEASAFLFGRAVLEASAGGAPGLSIVEGRFGLRQAASLRDYATQMDHSDYQSGYWLAPHASVAPGNGLATMLSWVGLGGSWTGGWAGDVGGNLAESPRGSFDPWSSSVDTGTPLLGMVSLQSTNYLFGYNVNEVLVYGRRSGSGTVYQLAEVPATQGQFSFPWSWTPDSSHTGTWELAAFVMTHTLPGVPLQVGNLEVVEVSAPSNQPPTAVDDSYSVGQGMVLSVGAPGILGNDTDPEDDPLHVERFWGPSHGSLDVMDNGSFAYYHDGSSATSDSFQYTVSDGINESALATVYIAIEVNDPPVAVNDHYTVGRGETIVVPPIDGLLRNDWDPDGDSVEVAGFSYPSHGTITDIYTDGRFTYTHDGSSGTTDSFTYTISDGEAVSGSATVDFTVVQTGDVRVSLEWWSDADMDLHVTDPFGETVSYLNPSTPSGGELDIDANAGCTSTTSSPVESIFWPTAAAPTGQYVVEVHYYGECLGEGVESVRVTTRVDGVLQFYDRSLSPGQWLEVVTFSR